MGVQKLQTTMASSVVAPAAPGFDPAAVWSAEELQGYGGSNPYPEIDDGYGDAKTRYNPTPGTGRTGFVPVPPNNFPWYGADEKYVPIIQADGGQLSEWQPMYSPSPEQEAEDRRVAFETGVPHGYVAPGDKYKGQPTITLRVVSLLHTDDEYGAVVDEDGRHIGGPFTITVSPKMRVHEVRNVIRDVGGILPGLQRLSYAGKLLEDAERTLQHYGIKFWNEKFPHWALVIRRY